MKLRILLVLGCLFLTLGMARPASAGPVNLIHVTTTAQGDTSGLPGGPLCSLQEAIYSANFDQAIAISSVNPDTFYSTGCEPGSGDDTIVLPNGSVFQMRAIVDDTHSQYGPAATPVIFSNITIEANGSTVEAAPGAPAMRAFSVGSGSVDLNPGGTPNVVSGIGNLTIKNAYITGFAVKGGDGADGGGGGMGAGGAIYVNAGGLTVDNSAFAANGATGGNGSAQAQQNPGGGGGGLSGNGGAAFGDPNLLGSGSGGGGGGSRGDGENARSGEGGGGGGTVNSAFRFFGGFNCGGDAGVVGSDGFDGFCPGGGGGAGGTPEQFILVFQGGDGGSGNYGGGGGGGGYLSADITGRQGGHGGNIGGGGGAGGFSDKGGDAGFGGGGGAGAGHNGKGSSFGGGQADDQHGGGGSAFGGAIFNDMGSVLVQNSTFFNNFVDRGVGGGGTADNGADAGGAIFSRNGSLTVQNATVSGNQGTGSGAGIVVMNDGVSASFTLDNTIIYGNGTHECFFSGSVSYSGVGNLIGDDFGCTGLAISPSPDPQLGPLQINSPGNTPTMAIQPDSMAVDVADKVTSLSTDQRGVTRPQGNGFDVGSFEAAPPTADLSLSKSVLSSTAQIGDTITYTLTLTNLGPLTANNAQLDDNLPSAVTFASCNATGGGVCSNSGNSVTVLYTTLAANTPVTITLQATLNMGVADGTMVGNIATVSASSPPDPNSNNNTAAATFVVQNKADLAVTKTVSAATVVAGNSFTYTIHLTNGGPYGAKGVVLSDSAPAGVTFTACTSTAGTCVFSGTAASLSLASFANGASATITIQGTLGFGAADGTTVANTATVTASTFDPNLNNNSATASFVVHNKADLFVTKKANATSVKSTDNLVYTVALKNLGPYQAAAVVMNDPVPSNSTFVKLSSTVPCTAPAKGTVGTVTCNLGTMANGATDTITITVMLNGSGNKTSITNTASANSPNFDPNLANNSASVTVQISGNKK